MASKERLDEIFAQVERESDKLSAEIEGQQHEEIAFKNIDPSLPLAHVEHIVNGFVAEKLMERVNWEGLDMDQAWGIVDSVVREDPKEYWMDGIEPDGLPPPGGNPQGTPGTQGEVMPRHEVWHDHGNRFDKAAEVDIGNVEGAAILTALRVEQWHEHPKIRPEPGEHRSTTFGDIIIDPEGVEYRFEVKEGGHPGFTEVTTIFDQGYTEYLAVRALEDAAAIGFYPTVDVHLGTERFDSIRELESAFRDVASPPDYRALAEEIRGDEQAARVRYYGPEDAATYEQRASEGAAMMRHPEPADPAELEGLIAGIEASWDRALDAGGWEPDPPMIQQPEPIFVDNRADYEAAKQSDRDVESRLLDAIEALLPYAENEAYSLDAHSDSPECEAEAEKAWEAVERATDLVASARYKLADLQIDDRNNDPADYERQLRQSAMRAANDNDRGRERER